MTERDQDQPHSQDEAQPQPQLSDVYANPQDTAFGRAAAEDQERVDRGEAPEHDETDHPRPWGKADPAT